MNPVLIFTDERRIAAEKATLNKVLTLFQNVYNAFASIEITVTLQDISTLVGWTVSGTNNTDFVQDFATNKVVDAAGALTIGGITLNKEKVIELMDALPDVSDVKAALGKSSATFNDANAVRAARTNLLSLAGGVIAKVQDSDSQIENLFTYYTKTDASAALATNMLTLCDALNAFKGTVTPLIPGWNFQQNPETLVLPGVTFIGGLFVLELGYFRAYESLLAN